MRRSGSNVAIVSFVLASLFAAPSYGAVRYVDDLGRTELHFAVMNNTVREIQLVDLEARDVNLETPLHYAARRFRPEATKILLESGADPHATNKDKQTALHLLGSTGPKAPELDAKAVEIAELLLRHDVQVNAKDAFGKTALDYAEQRNRVQLAQLLREHGGTSSPQPRAPAGYPTYSEIEAALLAAETAYPTLCRRHNLGQTVQGRDMWALCITDNVGAEEDEPEFRFISTMHGDEVVGVELCLRLINLLTTNYGSDPRITNIVDSIELWIVPCMNPDGYVIGQRTNASGIDLNRNFPDPFTSPENSTAGRAPETANIMQFGWDHSFTLAANYHCGALVVNYPFDNNPAGASVPTPSPDEDLFIFISEEYSQHNPPMWNSPSFFHGITNGAAWYAISGGMQDYSYRYLGCNEVTIEVSHVDGPPSAQMDQFWSENQESMLAYIETCLIGARGLVTDGASGLPMAASVRVEGRDHDVFTDPDVGDYHRMLLPGTYNLVFGAEPFDPVTVENVAVAAGDATVLNAELWQTLVQYPNGGEMLQTGQPTNVLWTGNPARQFQVQFSGNATETTLLFFDFESGLDPSFDTGGDALWSPSSDDSHGGFFSAKSGDISDSQSTWMSRQVDGGKISFWYSVSSEADWDWFNFYVDGEQRIHESGTVGWTSYVEVLPPGEIELRWEYVKDTNTTHGSDAVWVDEFSTFEDNSVWEDIALTAPGASSTEWTPLMPSDDCQVRIRSLVGPDFGVWDYSNDVFSVAGVPGDMNGDGRVDLTDFASFANCFGLQVSNPTPSCPGDQAMLSDLDASGVIDLVDFATFALNFTG